MMNSRSIYLALALVLFAYIPTLSNCATVTPTCCTKGYATYNITFTGLWANNSQYPYYPSKFPHWSPYIGAVHSSAVRIYAYGQLASANVKLIAEAGNEKPLKAELEKMPSKVKEIYVSAGNWLLPKAAFSVTVQVNTSFNLLSGLTMIAPSPDWCVGVDSYNFCTSSCGFIDKATIDLYLWDAGTKAGTTEEYSYVGTSTKVPIYQLKSTSNQTSVFYRSNNAALPPYATLQITRLSQYVNNGALAGQSSSIVVIALMIIVNFVANQTN